MLCRLVVAAALTAGASVALFAQSASLPDNPCDILTAQQVAAATRLAVTAVRRAPSIHKIVEAQTAGRQPGPGTICVYETRSEFGQITISVPRRAERTTARYREYRDSYFRAYRGAARTVPGLGADAWLSGGTTLQVLVRDNEYFNVQTQMYDRSADLLIALAKVIFARF